MAKSKKEAIIKEAPIAGKVPIQIRKIISLAKSVGPAVCRVGSQRTCASGFLCVVKPTFSAAGDIYTFVTNNHVIGDLSADSLNGYLLEFDSVPGMKPLQLSADTVGFSWTNKVFDATIIEIKLSSAARILNLGTHFLDVGKVITGSPGAVIGHPEGDEPSFDHGTISKIINEYQVLHRSSTKPGNSGSPLVTLEGQAVGIHCGSYNE